MNFDCVKSIAQKWDGQIHEFLKGLFNLDFPGNPGHFIDKNILTKTDWNE